MFAIDMWKKKRMDEAWNVQGEQSMHASNMPYLSSTGWMEERDVHAKNRSRLEGKSWDGRIHLG